MRSLLAALLVASDAPRGALHAPAGQRAARRTRLTAPATAPADSIDDVALAFGEALALAWRSDEAPLRRMLCDDASVSTPVWQCKDADTYASKIRGARAFFSNRARPTLTVVSHRALGPTSASVRWILGVEWPTVWRARVNILGETRLRLRSASAVEAAAETWHEPPLRVFTSQVLPRFRDMWSSWNTPTAEHVPIANEASADGYRIARIPPMRCVVAEWLETGELMLEEQAPLPPPAAFTGEVKRAEWYSTVSPGILERSVGKAELPGGMMQTAQRRRWIMPLPLRYADGVDVPLPDPDGSEEGDEPPGGVYGQRVTYESWAGARLAVRALRGPPDNKKVLLAAQELAAAAARDGLSPVLRGGKPVFYQLSYDIKVGFNRRAELAMAAWLFVPFVPFNEVGVLLEE